MDCVNYFIAKQTDNNSIQQLITPDLLTENQAPDVSNQSNTNFMEERVVDSQAAYPSTQIQLPSKVEAEMADSSWMARQQLMKPMQLGSIQWSTSQPVGTLLYSGKLPDILATPANGSILTRTLRMYAFYKIAPCFRIQINATQFHQGQLICSFDPFSLSDENETVVQGDSYNIVSATGFPHVRIMASESEAVELKIPFIHPRSFLTTNNENVYNTLGTFRVSVLNQLRAAEGTTQNVTATLWIYALDAEVHVPIQDHTPILNRVEPTFAITDLSIDIVDKAKKGFSQGRDMIGNFLTGNFGQALRIGQGLIDTLGDIFGFDYPSNPINSEKTIMPLENLAVGRGVSRSQRLAIDPYSLHPVDDDIASETIRAMDLKQVIKIPMLISQANWSVTTPVQSILSAFVVHPQVSPVVGQTATDLISQRTYLSYVSNGFNYWNGGIKYDIEVVATHFHSGKLLFAYVPNFSEDSTPPTYADAANSLPNATLDIQQTSHLTFVVPYTSSTSMKSTTILADTPSSYQVDASIGTLVVYVQNGLTAASNVFPSIDINVYVSAADDFNLYVPRRPTVYNPIPPTPPPEPSRIGLAVEATIGISIKDDRNQSSPSTAVLSKEQDISIPRKHFGENYTLIDLLRRFSFSGFYIAPAQSLAGTPVVELVTPASSILFNNLFQSYLVYWGGIYSAWAGSIRYKYSVAEPRTSTKSLIVYHEPDVIPTSTQLLSQIGPANINGYGASKTNLSQDNCVEVEVPYYSKFNMLINRLDNPDLEIARAYSSNGNMNIFCYDTADEQTDTIIESYIAAGEDFRFIYLRPPPTSLAGPATDIEEPLLFFNTLVFSFTPSEPEQ